jgi:ABC-type transport system involved in multi-copper enzyme maturation permease subunit
MRTLLKREFDDMRVAILSISILTLLFIPAIVLPVWSVYSNNYRPPLTAPNEISSVWFFIILIFFPMVFTSLANHRMNSDRRNKISTYLSTLATSRLQIFLARFIAGLICILAVLLVFAITTALSLNFFPPVTSIDTSLLYRTAAAFFCLCLAGYSLGLMTGWSPNKYLTSIGALALILLTLSVILFKGLSVVAMLILLTLAASAVLIAWYKYSTSSL